MTQQWKPIESAPKDFSTEFDGWNGERVPNVIWAHPEYEAKGEYAWCRSVYVHGHGWEMERVLGLTHWMPLPDAPCQTCNYQGAVGNVLIAQPCPDCTSPASAQDDAKDERTKVMEIIAGVWDHGTQIDDAADEVIDLLLSNVPASGDAQTAAARDVLDERQRQIIGEGFSTARDDGYTNLELADAAAQYALQAGGWPSLNVWPWKPDTFKEGAPREMLVKAGALILAEIERLDRAASQQQGDAA